MPPTKVKLDILYGIPCVGKSTLAVKLAYQRGIRTIIATDYIREVQRKYVSRDEAPALALVTHDAWRLYGAPTRANIQRGFLDHTEQVAGGIKAVTAKIVRDGFDAIVEGAHFHGSIISDLRAECPGAEIEPTLLAVENAQELRRRIARKESARTLGAAKKQWQEHLDAMLVIQDFLIADAESCRIPIITEHKWGKPCVPT